MRELTRPSHSATGGAAVSLFRGNINFRHFRGRQESITTASVRRSSSFCASRHCLASELKVDDDDDDGTACRAACHIGSLASTSSRADRPRTFAGDPAARRPSLLSSHPPFVPLLAVSRTSRFSRMTFRGRAALPPFPLSLSG